MPLRLRNLCSRPDRSDRGQTTTEYAIVLTAVAGMVALFGLWAQDTDRIGQLFDAVFDRIVGTLS